MEEGFLTCSSRAPSRSEIREALPQGHGLTSNAVSQFDNVKRSAHRTTAVWYSSHAFSAAMSSRGASSRNVSIGNELDRHGAIARIGTGDEGGFGPEGGERAKCRTLRAARDLPRRLLSVSKELDRVEIYGGELHRPAVGVDLQNDRFLSAFDRGERAKRPRFAGQYPPKNGHEAARRRRFTTRSARRRARQVGVRSRVGARNRIGSGRRRGTVGRAPRRVAPRGRAGEQPLRLVPGLGSLRAADDRAEKIQRRGMVF